MAQAESRSITSRRAFLANVGAAAVAVPAVSAAATSPDAELLALGRDLEAAWKHEAAVEALWHKISTHVADAATEAAYDATSKIASAIKDMSATTIDGLRVKARAVAWCHSGDLPVIQLSDQRCTNILLAEGIIADLLAMGA